MPTIGSTLRASGRRLPDAAALSFGDATYSYAELDAAVDRAAGALDRWGLRPGDRVGLMAENSDRFVVAFYAASRIGAVVVPVNPGSAPAEIAHVVEDSGSRVLLVDSAADETGALPAVRGHLEHVLALSSSITMPTLHRAGDRPWDPQRDSVVNETDNSLILYTSGTTGRAKGALFDHHRTVWVAASVLATCGIRTGDRLLHVAPLFHAAELCVMLVPGTLIGAKHVIHGGFDPGQVLDTLEAERITMMFGVPAMYRFLLRQPDLAARDLGAWRTALFGAAPMPRSDVEELSAALPAVELMQLCGQTEAGPGGIYLSSEQVKARPDASGRQALPLTEARIVDAQGEPVKPGGTGELVLRGEIVMKEYWRNPAATAETLRGGWLHTGDIARLDEDGFITLVDRLKDMIITGGRNVYSVEVENALAAHPAVAGVAVVGQPHAEYGESIIAVVELREGASLSLDETRQFCASQIARYKLPHQLVIAPIPRSAAGKVLKRQLRAAFAGGAAATAFAGS